EKENLQTSNKAQEITLPDKPSNSKLNIDIASWFKDLKQEYSARKLFCIVNNFKNTFLDFNEKSENSTEIEIENYGKLTKEK
ncbi:3336_t:CDS:1, partial [Scutellospora calospora]